MPFRLEDLGVLAYSQNARGFVHHVYGTADTLDEVLRPGYFNAGAHQLRSRDKLTILADIDTAAACFDAFVIHNDGRLVEIETVTTVARKRMPAEAA